MTAVELDPNDAGQALGATGVLAAFNQARVLDSADVHVAERLGELAGDDTAPVLLAAALAVRALREGSVCVEIARAHDVAPGDGTDPAVVAALSWPDPADWITTLEEIGRAHV